MILFIAPNPHKVKEKEGFLQRVEAIDKVFNDEKKVYSDDLKNNIELADAVIKADLIYVHSVYNANKILKAYELFPEKIITDLHGVVPEEEEYADNIEVARVMAATEASVFKCGMYFVAVSDAMKKHFESKYELSSKVRWITLPIFNGVKSSIIKKKLTGHKNVVYAGGAQSWQNVDTMVNAINTSDKQYQFTILTHLPEAFNSITGDAKNRTIIKTVSSNEILKYYKQAVLGFVLRKDIIINRVACPTKLIEYLSHGVVPIVLSENIGDFKKLGYSFVKLDDFCKNKITDKQIESAINHNYQVYERFLEKIKQGEAELKHLGGMLIQTSGMRMPIFDKDSLSLELVNQSLTDKIIRYEYQIEEYRKKIVEYADLAEHYRMELGEVKKSKLQHRIKRIGAKIKNRVKPNS